MGIWDSWNIFIVSAQLSKNTNNFVINNIIHNNNSNKILKLIYYCKHYSEYI